MFISHEFPLKLEKMGILGILNTVTDKRRHIPENNLKLFSIASGCDREVSPYPSLGSTKFSKF